MSSTSTSVRVNCGLRRTRYQRTVHKRAWPALGLSDKRPGEAGAMATRTFRSEKEDFKVGSEEGRHSFSPV